MSKNILKHYISDLKTVSTSKDIITKSGKFKISSDNFCLNCKLNLGNYQQKPKIVVLLSGYPYAFYDKTQDSYEGLAIDVLDKLIKDLELKPNITYIPLSRVDFNKAIDDIADGKYDMGVGNFHNTPNRERKVNFTSPIYLTTTSLLFQGKADYFDMTKNMLKIWIKPLSILLSLAIILGMISYFIKGRYSSKKHKISWHLWGTLGALLGEPGTVIEEADLKNNFSLFLGLLILAISFYLGIYLTAITTTAALKYTSHYDPFIKKSGIKNKKIIINKGTAYIKEIEKYGGIPVLKERKHSGVEMLLKNPATIDAYYNDEGYIIKELNDRPDIKLNYSKWTQKNIGVEPIGFPINKNLTGLMRAVNIQIMKLHETNFIESQCLHWMDSRPNINLCKL
jgi:ABC-type amino acid transport substrate-binding protein